MRQRQRGLRALTCAGAIAIGLLAPGPWAAADEQADEVEELVLDFLKSGGENPTDEEKLAEAGVDMSIGIMSLGLTALGVPGAGAALSSLKSMFFGGTDAIPSAVEKRFSKLEANLRDVRSDLTLIQGNVNKLNQDLASNSNGDRIDNLAPLNRDIRDVARRVTEVPSMSQPARNNYVDRALDIADEFLPASQIGSKMWSWDNIRVQANMKTNRKPLLTRETVYDMNVALEPYLYSVGALAAAIDATGVRPVEARLQPHYQFLDELMENSHENTCKLAAGPRKVNGQCSVTLRCTSALATRTRSISYGLFEDPNYGPVCRNSDWESAFEKLRLEVAKANLEVFDVISGGKSTLSNAGKAQMMFAKTVRAELDAVYAVDAEGRLYKYLHFMEERGKPNCAGPNAKANPACVPPDITNMKLKCGPGVLAAGCEAPVLQSLPAPLNYNHELARPTIQGGAWGGFSQVIVSQWLGNDLVVYGVEPKGALLWRKVQNVRVDGPPTVVEAQRPVGVGWNSLKNVFSTGEGVLYGVAANGELVWYRHVNNYDGNQPPEWKQRAVGTGWGEFIRLFSPGEGVIYAVKPDGSLMWYKHHGYLDGRGLSDPGSWTGPVQVGSGWNNFKHVFAGPDGNIYAVNDKGELLFYKNLGWRTGEASWIGPVKIGDGWSEAKIAFAAMGGSTAGPIVK